MVDALNPELETTASALRTVPRHEFIPEAWRDFAYTDRPPPIGDGQTIRAPSIVAEMCDHPALTAGDRTLEIGTGCGYHAPVTSEIVGADNVYTVEIDAGLAETARDRLSDLEYGDVSVRVGDGREGWPEYAPYDKAYLTCADRQIPGQIVEQTCGGGLMLAPIGLADQRLVFAKKRDDGLLERLDCGPVQFVTMQGADV